MADAGGPDVPGDAVGWWPAVGPGQRHDVIWTALNLGKWMIHCHIPHHTTNNNTEQNGGGGSMMHIDVAGDPTTLRQNV
jgi:FtsP/CotA-like multicopper oxidase with cupredoxin domain